jgi:pyridoxamine 5'-phosphate oxidase
MPAGGLKIGREIGGFVGHNSRIIIVEVIMDEWLTLLRDAIATEGEDRPLAMALATLSRNGSPRVRTVICREIAADGAIWLVGDSRSNKNEQIKLNRRVEGVFWFSIARRQYRIRGEARVVPASDPGAGELWRKLPDSTRAMFTWPTPGETRSEPDDRFAASVAADVGPPDTFEAIAIHPSLVEELDLNQHPHRRRRWRRKTGWAVEEINP